MAEDFTITTRSSESSSMSHLGGVDERRSAVLPDSGFSSVLGSSEDTEHLIFAESNDSVSGVLRTQQSPKPTSVRLSAAVSNQEFASSLADDYENSEIEGLFADWAMDPLDLLMVSNVW